MHIFFLMGFNCIAIMKIWYVQIIDLSYSFKEDQSMEALFDMFCSCSVQYI